MHAVHPAPMNKTDTINVLLRSGRSERAQFRTPNDGHDLQYAQASECNNNLHKTYRSIYKGLIATVKREYLTFCTKSLYLIVTNVSLPGAHSRQPRVHVLFDGLTAYVQAPLRT
jgi:hypothetical protein